MSLMEEKLGARREGVGRVGESRGRLEPSLVKSQLEEFRPFPRRATVAGFGGI